MKHPVRLLLLGLLTWTVPFVVAFAFYDRQGQLATSYGLFKSTMVVVSGLTGCFALYRYMSKIETGFIRHAWIAGLVWLALNLLLDILILIPMSGMSFKEYLTTIAPGYLLIPVICVSGGMLMQLHRPFNNS